MSHEPMSQLIEYRLFDEQTMSRVVSANGKSTYSMSPRGPSPRSRGHWRPGSLLLSDLIQLSLLLVCRPKTIGPIGL